MTDRDDAAARAGRDRAKQQAPLGGPDAGGRRGPDVLHAPWRLSYMDMLSKLEAAGKHAADADPAPAHRPDPPPAAHSEAPPAPVPDPAQASCFLRRYWLEPHRDDDHHVVVRTGTHDAPGDGRGGLILLNAYPYTNGHLLVCLGESRPRLLDYTPDQRAELWSLVDLAVDLCERAFGPQGVNVGVNQGRAAGAGVPEHLHVHVVPRWSGDVNFITVVGGVRVLPSALEDVWERYRKVWDEVRGGAG